MNKCIRIATTPLFVVVLIIGGLTCSLFVSLDYLWHGQSSVVTSLTIYTCLFIAAYGLFKLILGRRYSENLKALTFGVFAAIILLETGLRYTTIKYQSYMEQNGDFWYYCLYRSPYIAEPGYDSRMFLGPRSFTRIDDKEELCVESTFNSIGLRDDEPDKEQMDTSYIIVGFGDSFTQGDGAPQDSTWTKLLAQELKSCRSDILSVNAGIAGSDIVYEMFKLENLISDFYTPDLVIFAINSSDIGDLIIRGGAERFVAENNVVYRSGPWWKDLYSFSYICRMISHDIMGFDWLLLTDAHYAELEQEAKEQIYLTITEQIVPFTESKNIKTLFVFTPMEWELEEESFAYTEISKRLLNNGVKVLDLHENFSKYSKSNVDYYWDIDLHCNSDGYLLWSRAIKDKVIQDRLIECDWGRVN